MARGTTLSSLVQQLRAEVGHSVNPAVGQEKLAQLQQVLRRHQELLYDEYTWNFLRVRDADKVLAAGQRYYDFPAAINPDRVESVSVRWGNQWIPVRFGIDAEREYNVSDSGLGERTDPVERWDWHDDDGQLQFEVWPMPTGPGTIRFSGIKPLAPLVANDDRAALDDRLIVLFAAAELRQGQDDAQIKENLAARRLLKMRAHGSKAGPTRIGGDHVDRARQPVTIRIAGA